MEYHRINPFVKLNKEQVERIFADAGLGSVTDFCPLSAGMSNSGYRVQTQSGIYLLKIYAKATGKAEAGMLSYLSDKIAVPKLFYYRKEKPSYTISEFLEGEAFDRYLKRGEALSLDLAAQLGTMLAVIHCRQYSQDATLDANLEPLTARPTEREKLLYTLTRKPAAHLGPKTVEKLRLYVNDHSADFDRIEARHVLLHGDLSFENMMLKDGKLYLIDFEFASAGSPYCDLGHLFRTDESQRERFLLTHKEILSAFQDAYNNVAPEKLPGDWLYLSRLADLNSLLCLLNSDDPPAEWIHTIEQEILDLTQ